MIRQIIHAFCSVWPSLSCFKYIIMVANAFQATTPAHAEGWQLGMYYGKWANTRLPYLPYNVATGRITFSESYLTSLVVSRHLLTADLFVPGTSIGFAKARTEIEGIASLHRGYQEHQEATLAIMLRTRDHDLGSVGSINFGWAHGFSYALSAPKYEYGRNQLRGQDTVQLQYYMGLEAEYTPEDWDRISIFARLHHRSGIYGVISPSKTGSNLIGVGLRVDLPK